MTHRPLLLIALMATASGCLGSALTGDDTGGGGGGGTGGGTPDMTSGDYVDKFYTEVAPILTPACGGCHGVTGQPSPAFMIAAPDMLQNILAYPGIIGVTPEKSRLYMKSTHEGPAFTPTEAPVIRAWIDFFNANRPAPTGGSDGGTVSKPTVKPFTPVMNGTGGSNVVDLAVLDAALTGQKLSFDAKMVGSSLQLSNIKVVAAASMGVHVVHPVFVTWDQNLTPAPDPVDSFAGLDLTVYMTQTATMGPGTVFLPNYATGSLLNVIFTTIETKTGMGTTTTTGCKALANFVANVKPLLQANCNTCHVGGAPTAGLAFDATPDATLCLNALTEINKTTPAQSLLLTKPDPAVGNGHPRKVNPFTAFQTAVTNWINLEK